VVIPRLPVHYLPAAIFVRIKESTIILEHASTVVSAFVSGATLVTAETASAHPHHHSTKVRHKTDEAVDESKNERDRRREDAKSPPQNEAGLGINLRMGHTAVQPASNKAVPQVKGAVVPAP